MERGEIIKRITSAVVKATPTGQEILIILEAIFHRVYTHKEFPIYYSHCPTVEYGCAREAVSLAENSEELKRCLIKK